MFAVGHGHQWREDKGAGNWRATTRCAVTHHPEGPSLRRGQVALLPGKHGWTRWQGGKSGGEAGIGRDCISNVEKESFQKHQFKQRNQTMCPQNRGKVCIIVYGAETWAVSQQGLKKLRTFQMVVVRGSYFLVLLTHVQLLSMYCVVKLCTQQTARSSK